MFKQRLLHSLALVLVLAASCAKTEPTIFEASTPFAAGALTKSAKVTVTCDFVWNAKLEDSSWGKLGTVDVTEQGGTVEIVLGANTGADERKNTLILTSGSQELRREIVQKGASSLFGKIEIVLVGAGEQQLSFNSPLPWTASISEGADWIEPLEATSGNGGSVRLSLKAQGEFIDIGERTGALEFTFDGTDKFTLPVRQRQTDVILLSDDNIELANFEEATVTIATAYNVDYSVSVDAEWIEIVETKALHEGSVTFRIGENSSAQSRKGVITFTGEGVTSKVTVTQPARDPILDHQEPGAYYVDGMDYVFAAGSFSQFSRTYFPDGTFEMRLVDAQSGLNAELKGFLLPSATGDDAKVRLTLRRHGRTTYTRAWDTKVFYIKGDRMWLKDVKGDTRFVVKF